jgi:hypothetical protein
MKIIPLFGAVLLLALPCRVAWSQTGESRAQVKAETRAAEVKGEIPINDEGLAPNEVNPGRYPKKPAASAVTRAEVKKETQEARKAGDIPFGDVGLTPREVNQKHHPSKQADSKLTRGEVKRDTQAAVRAGDVQVGDDGRTLAEKDPQRYEGAPAKAPKLTFRRGAGTSAWAGSSPAN